LKSHETQKALCKTQQILEKVRAAWAHRKTDSGAAGHPNFFHVGIRVFDAAVTDLRIRFFGVI